MRFRRRRNRPSLDIPTSENGDYQRPYDLWHVSGRTGIGWNTPWSHFQRCRAYTSKMTGYTPKCLTSVSQSDILTGDRVENFSHECWLQNHLNRFGVNISGNHADNISGNHDEQISDTEPDYDDDSPVSSIGTEVNSISSHEDDIVNRLYLNYRHLQDMDNFPSIEPPPYGLPDLPPSYEEAIAGDRISTGSGSVNSASTASSVDFILY